MNPLVFKKIILFLLFSVLSLSVLDSLHSSLSPEFSVLENSQKIIPEPLNEGFQGITSETTRGELTSSSQKNAKLNELNQTLMDVPSTLVMTKSQMGSFVVGDLKEYTLTIRNEGSIETNGSLKIVDILPKGLSFMNATGQDWTFEVEGQTVTCLHLNSIAAGESAPPLTLIVSVAPEAIPSVTSNIIATLNDIPTTTFSDVTLVDGVPQSRLTLLNTHLTKNSDDQQETYQLIVINSGSAPTNGTPVVVTDKVPTGLSFISGSGTDWTIHCSEDVITCTSSKILAPGQESAPIILNMTSHTNASSLTNQAIVSGGGAVNIGTADYVSLFDSVAEDTTLANAKFAHLNDKQNETYTLTVGNHGIEPTSGTLTFKDWLPSATTRMLPLGDHWDVSVSDQLVKATTKASIPVGKIIKPLRMQVGCTVTTSPTTPNLANAKVGVYYSQTIMLSGGSPPYALLTPTGPSQLPPDLKIYFDPSNNSNVIISGTPTTVGSYPFTFTVISAGPDSCEGTISYTITTYTCPPDITFTPPTLPSGPVGTLYNQTLTPVVGEGTAPYKFTVTGSLPPGLYPSPQPGFPAQTTSLLIGGYPTTSGVYNFDITATDVNGCSGDPQPYSITITCPEITFTPTNEMLPPGLVGVAYPPGSETVKITASGTPGPYMYSVVQGTLPPGLQLNPDNGEITGVPTAPLSPYPHTFVVEAKDTTANCVGFMTYTIPVQCSTITISSNPAVHNGTVGAAYTPPIQLTAQEDGYTGSFTYSVLSGTFPPGLDLEPTGSISGTPTHMGFYSFAIQATDLNGCVGSVSYTINIACPSITISSNPAVHDGTVGAAYTPTIQLTAQEAGYMGSFTYSVLSGTFPPGLDLEPTGSISGTPTHMGFYSFAIQATDLNGCVGSVSYTINIACPSITISSNPAVHDGTVGAAYTPTIQLTAQEAGYMGSFTYSVLSGTFPPGLDLEPTGSISGTPTHMGFYSFAIQATDLNGCVGSVSYTINIACPSITISSNPAVHDGTVGAAYTPTIQLTAQEAGYMGSFTYSVLSGTFPPGLNLDPTGSISGTPTQIGTYTFGIQATDSYGCVGSMQYTIPIKCPVITITPSPTSPLTSGTVGKPYPPLPGETVQITPEDGTPPYTFTVTSGALPPGVELNPANGMISGTPTRAGTYSFDILVKDFYNCTASVTYTLPISCPPITISSSIPIPAGTVGSPYPPGDTPLQISASITGVTPTPYYTLWVASGDLPPGVEFNPANGMISGTPTKAGNYSFDIEARFFDNCLASATYTIPITCPLITITSPPSPLSSGTVGTPYTPVQIVATEEGYTGSFTYSVLSRTFPPGLVLDPTGTISGTPTQMGDYSFDIQATDSNGCVGSKQYTIHIKCPTITINPPTSTTLTAGTVGMAYGPVLIEPSEGEGTLPYTFTVTSGALPPGVELNPANGMIWGTPTSAGTYSFDILVKDFYNCAASVTYTLPITCPTITITPPTLTPPPGGFVVGTPYGPVRIIPSIGGITPPYYTFSVANEDLPPGLKFNPANGEISGTLTKAGTYSFDIEVQAFDNCFASITYTITVNCPNIALVAAILDAGYVGEPYSALISGHGGTPPDTFSFISGSLPPGVVLDPTTGVISGYPTQMGIYTFDIEETDRYGCIGTRTYTIPINCPIISFITPSPLPSGPVGMFYSTTINVSGDPLSHTFSVINGSLPPGLHLNPNSGIISGIPTLAGPYSFTIEVLDSDNCSAAMTYTLLITCPIISLTTPSPLPNGTLDTPYSTTIAASGGSMPYTFSVISGFLPPGLVLTSTTGVISGIPILAGTYTFDVQLTDAFGCVSIVAYNITINCPGGTLGLISPTTGLVGIPYSSGSSLTVSGGASAYAFSVINGSLPPGLVLSGSGTTTPVISGIPTRVGTYAFTIIAETGPGCVGSQTCCALSENVSLTIYCPTITLDPICRPVGELKTYYETSVQASGGTAPYTYSVSSGQLPPGLVVNTVTGIISGIPAKLGVYGFTVTAIDHNGCVGSQNYSIQIKRKESCFHKKHKPRPSKRKYSYRMK